MNQFDQQWAESAALATWNADPQLRAEFSDDRGAYVAYALAKEKGLARIFNDGPVVNGADIARQQLIQQQAAEHSRLNAPARGAR